MRTVKSLRTWTIRFRPISGTGNEFSANRLRPDAAQRGLRGRRVRLRSASSPPSCFCRSCVGSCSPGSGSRCAGAENIPRSGSALLVSNHAGHAAAGRDDPARRWSTTSSDATSGCSARIWSSRRRTPTTGAQDRHHAGLPGGRRAVPGSRPDWSRCSPRASRASGKPYADRYKLQRFGRGGFVSAAVRAQVPIVPVSVVGSEEIYPLLAPRRGWRGRSGFPYFPVTPPSRGSGCSG